MAEIQLQFSVAMAPVIRFQQNHRHQQLWRDISEKWAHLKLKSQCCNYHAQQSISEVRRYVSLWGVNVCLAISLPLRAVMIPVALMPQSSSVALQHQTHTLHTMCPLCNINALMSDSRLRAVFFFFLSWPYLTVKTLCIFYEMSGQSQWPSLSTSSWCVGKLSGTYWLPCLTQVGAADWLWSKRCPLYCKALLGL